MGKGLFTSDTLTKILGDDGVEILKENAIDAGQAFLTGGVTNAMSSVGSSKAVSSVINATSTGLGVAAFGKQLYDSAPDILTTLGSQIATEAVSILTAEGTKLISEYTANHVAACASFPSQVSSYAISYFNDHKMPVEDVVKKLTESAEQSTDNAVEEQKKKSMSEFVGNMKSKMGEFTNKVSDFISTGSSYVQMITSYISNGPDWVVDQMDKQLSNLCDNANKIVTKQWEKDKESYSKTAKNMGESIGADMVAKFNAELTKAQKKQLLKIERQKHKVNAKTIAALGKAKAQIASLTGVYIP